MHTQGFPARGDRFTGIIAVGQPVHSESYCPVGVVLAEAGKERTRRSR